MNKKLVYRVLLCDDNPYFLDELKTNLLEIVEKRQDFTIEPDCARYGDEIDKALNDHTYDLITLDMCFTNKEEIQNVREILRYKLYANLYGADLYSTVIRSCIDPLVTKVLVVSRIDDSILRPVLNFDPNIDYFCKTTITPRQIANHIAAYFSTNKKKLYNNVFVVYGHNLTMRDSVERYLRELNIRSVDLYYESVGGLNSFIDSLTDAANISQCAIVLLSADDITINIDRMEMQYRARQNVIFEMGLFLGKLGKDKIIVLHEQHNNFEFPSDIQGIFYIGYDESKPERWKEELKHRLEKIGF